MSPARPKDTTSVTVLIQRIGHHPPPSATLSKLDCPRSVISFPDGVTDSDSKVAVVSLAEAESTLPGDSDPAAEGM